MHNPEHQSQSPSARQAFGSPKPFHLQGKGAAAMANPRSPFHNHPFQAGNALGHTVSRLASTSEGGKQQQPSTAQLTIFYAGMVNVYNDVPFDKAQAIMLLAGSGTSWSSNYMSPAVASGAAARRNPFLKTPMSAPQSTPSTPGSPMGSPRVPSRAGHPPRPGVVFSNVRQPPITNVELPQARKASLARFLEKRKDRVRKPAVNENVDCAPTSQDKSPGPSPGEPSSSAPHPSPSSPVQDQHGDPGSFHEPNSPPTKPPCTPPQQNNLDSEKKSPAPKRRDHSDQAHFKKRARSESAPRESSSR